MGTNTTKIFFSNGTGFDPPVEHGQILSNEWFSASYPGRVNVMDVNGDGRQDIVAMGTGVTYIAFNTGNGFQLASHPEILPNQWFSEDFPGRVMSIDVNGDGRNDIVAVGTGETYIAFSNGNGFDPKVQFGQVLWNEWFLPDYPGRVRVMDVNGDGLKDIVATGTGVTYIAFSTGGGFRLTSHTEFLPNEWFTRAYPGRVMSYDANGDGLEDLIAMGTGVTHIALSNGGGFSSKVSTGQTLPNEWFSDTFPGRVRVTNLNDDRYPDLVAIGTGVTYTALGRGDRYDALTSNSQVLWNEWFSPSYPGRVFDMDVNGDGRPDVVGVGTEVTYIAINSNDPGKQPDFVTEIDIGNGVVRGVRYRSLTDASVYSKGGDATYPTVDFQGPIYVVADVELTILGSPLRSERYFYSEARLNRHGRGLLGFRMLSTTDQQTNIVTTTTYRQDFPFVGAVESVETKLSDVVLKRSNTTHRSSQPYAGIFQVHAAVSTEHTYELNNTLVSSVVTDYKQYDAYGNPLLIVTTSTGNNETYTKTTVNSYDNAPPLWHLGRLTNATVTSTSPSGTETRTSAFEYDPTTGLLTAEIIEPNDPKLMLRTEYGYDTYGNKTSVTVRDSGGNSYPIVAATSSTSYDYSQLAVNGTYAITSTNAKGHTETQVIDARFGKPLSLTGPNGLTTLWQYDGFGRQIREIRADGTETTIDMIWCDSNCAGVANAVYKVTTQTTGSALTSAYFDALGRELRSEALSLDGRTLYKDTQYNALGQVARLSRPYFAGTTPHWTDYQYDAIGRVWKETSPDGGIAETTYNGLSTSLHRYSVNDSYNQTITRINNLEGNLVQVIDEDYQTTHYEYDPLGNLIRVTDPGNNATLMSYDRRGRKISMNEPNMGAWEYRYDALGQLRWQKDAKNQVVTMDYDVLGRMIQRVQPEGTSTWIYDTRSKGIGKLSQAKGPDGYIERHYYDAYGRPRQVQKIIDGATLTTTKAYDAQGRVDRLTYPSGAAVRYQYNTYGHLYRLVNHANTAEQYWTAQDSDADGHIIQELLGNGLTTVRNFDPASGRLSYLGTFGGSHDVQALNYQFDALGNLKNREDYLASLSESFQYDTFNRLTQATIAGVGSKAWSYDGLGNITSKGGHSDYAYTSGRPHAVSYARGGAYSYDNNGNMTVGGGRVITWTSDNKPKRITRGSAVAEFNYSPDGARYKQVSTVDGLATTTLYAGSHHERVTVNGITTHKDYVSAGGRVVAIRETVNSTATIKYLHQDHLGSTDVITDASGQVVERMSFDAFGSRRVASNWNDPVAALVGLSSTRGFTGHEQLDGIGLIHMNGRVYDPELGRFLSADPMVKYPAGAQGLNRYSYVDNNPLSRVDPSGYGWFSKTWKKIKKWVKPIVAAIVAYYTFGWAAIMTSGNLVAAGALSGFAGGAIATGTLKGALSGAAIGGITGGFASVFSNSVRAGEVAAGAIGNSASARAAGGRWQDGYWSGGFTSFSSPFIGTARGGWVGRTVASAVVGGTATELGGGKFANGATTFGFLRLFGEFADYAGRQTDRLKQLACNSGGKPCEFDGDVLRTDGGRDVDWSRNPGKNGNWLTRSGMALEGDPHIYDNHAVARTFVVDVSKIHDWFNSWNYNPGNGFYMSRGVAFDSAFQIYSFAGMPVAGLATVAGYAGNLPFDQQMLYYNIHRNSRRND